MSLRRGVGITQLEPLENIAWVKAPPGVQEGDYSVFGGWT